MRPVFLLSDFGLKDPFVGLMKAQILQTSPQSPLVDLSHEIPAQNVFKAAFTLKTCIDWLPSNAVVLAIVDPGVGSSRRALALKLGTRWIVAPDNGIVDLLLIKDRFTDCRTLSTKKASSSTFHGRDVFAPAAALIARDENEFVKTTPTTRPSPVQLSLPAHELLGEGGYRVAHLHTDEFGNLLFAWHQDEGDPIEVRLNGTLLPFVHCFSDLKPGQCGSLWGSSGYLEVFQTEGSAAARFEDSPLDLILKPGCNCRHV